MQGQLQRLAGEPQAHMPSVNQNAQDQSTGLQIMGFQALFGHDPLTLQMMTKVYNIQPDVSMCTVGFRCIQPPDVFPLTSILNKSCNIECGVNNMLRIIQNRMVSQGLQLELSTVEPHN